MDQGLAAALAGVAGLIGAGIGGIATAYGARVGADKTIEAVQTQVHGQSTAEHAHWVREQRRQLCSDITDAYASFMEASAICSTWIRMGEAASREALDWISHSEVALINHCARTQLWGPDELEDAALTLLTTARSLSKSASDWRRVVETGEQDVIHAHQTDHARKIVQGAWAWNAFANVARTTLGSPP